MLPVVEELFPVPSPSETLAGFASWPDVVLFESALQRDRLGRYSFLAADPFATFEIQRAEFGSDPFAGVRREMSRFEARSIPGLPPFQGGAAGVLSYELGGAFERIPRTGFDEFSIPDSWIGVYDWVIAWDHQEDRAWIISQGLPETDTARRSDRAVARLKEVKACLSKTADEKPSTTHEPVAFENSAPQFPLTGFHGISSDFRRDDYLKSVERIIEYIYAGDIYQANLSQRLSAAWGASPVSLYDKLRKCNPAPFAGFLKHDDWAVVSASPERFLRVEDGVVETRPIKGTRQRRRGPEADLFTRDELRESEKDVAENVMIVDLLRNDLSRVCEPGSIAVPELCVVESYETVQHLVSEVRGRLRSVGGRVVEDVWSLLAASFPGGSITGAPKVRSMEIIAELEPTARGPYCGSLFYTGFNGRMDSSVLIRTFVWRSGCVQFSAGGGIVAQSDPVAEYDETLHKAAGLLRVFEQ